MERTFDIGYFIVAVLSIVHVESVMMLSCEDHIFHSSILRRSSPFFRIEFYRIECLFQIFILPDIVKIVHSFRSHHTKFICFRTNGPGLYYTPLAVCSPMDKHTEFHILPFCYIFPYNAFLRIDIRRFTVSILFVHHRILCKYCNSSDKHGKKRCYYFFLHFPHFI